MNTFTLRLLSFRSELLWYERILYKFGYWMDSSELDRFSTSSSQYNFGSTRSSALQGHLRFELDSDSRILNPYLS